MTLFRQFFFSFMGIVWAAWWVMSVRKCSRRLKSLPYLSTRYRQVTRVIHTLYFCLSAETAPNFLTLTRALCSCPSLFSYGSVCGWGCTCSPRTPTRSRSCNQDTFTYLPAITTTPRRWFACISPPATCVTYLTFLHQIIVTVYFSFAVIVSAVACSYKFKTFSYLRIRRFFPPKKARRIILHPVCSSRCLALTRNPPCKKHCLSMQRRIHTLKLTLRRRLSYGSTKKKHCSRG